MCAFEGKEWSCHRFSFHFLNILVSVFIFYRAACIGVVRRLVSRKSSEYTQVGVENLFLCLQNCRVKSLPNDRILDWTKLKAIADDKMMTLLK